MLYHSKSSSISIYERTQHQKKQINGVVSNQDLTQDDHDNHDSIH
jgi:hypothetical protein